MYGRVVYTTLLVVLGSVFVWSALTFFRGFKSAFASDGPHDYDKEEAQMWCGGIPALVLVLPLVFEIIPKVIKVWIAPRLYLIEKIHSLIN